MTSPGCSPYSYTDELRGLGWKTKRSGESVRLFCALTPVMAVAAPVVLLFLKCPDTQVQRRHAHSC